jgi:hypothetical protein
MTGQIPALLLASIDTAPQPGGNEDNVGRVMPFEANIRVA